MRATPVPTTQQQIMAQPQGSMAVPAAEPTVRELLHLIPTFSSPVVLWAQKVLLLTKRVPPTSATLLDVVLSRLPDTLFKQASTQTFANINDLLAHVQQLELGALPQQASHYFSKSDGATSSRKPSERYIDFVCETRQLLSSASEELVAELAKLKLMATLCPSAQALITVAPKETPFSTTLQAIDMLPTTAFPKQADVAAVRSMDTDADTTVSDPTDFTQLVARIKQLEGMVERSLPNQPLRAPVQQHNSRTSDICWYHDKFGDRARRCEPPCRFRGSKNY
jgi:hypothetical protein